MDTVTDQQREILAIEAQFWRTPGAKDDAIRAMGLSATRYYQLLVALIDDPAVLAADPQLVYRLQRICRRSARTVYTESAALENGGHHRVQ